MGDKNFHTFIDFGKNEISACSFNKETEKIEDQFVLTIKNNQSKDFLSEEEFKKLNKTFHLANFPWYFIPFKVQPDDDYYQFYHLFIAKGKIHSKYYDILHPILTKLEAKKILRIKANLTLKQATNTSSEMHIDFKDCKTSIFYLNSNNGYTQFEKERHI